MTYALDQKKLTQQLIYFVIINLPRCEHEYGVLPCTASGGQCSFARPDCEDPLNFSKVDGGRDYYFCSRGVLLFKGLEVWPLIEDVSGISTYKGTYFNIGRFLAALAASIVAGTFVGTVLAGVVALLVGALIRDTLEVPRAQAGLVAVGLLGVVLLLISGRIARDRIWKPVFASIGASLLAGPGAIGLTLGALSRFTGGRGGEGLANLMVIAAFLAGIYALVTMFWYARSEGLSLTIGSKGGANTPIAISGISVFGLFTTAAFRALNAAPAADAAIMIKELGAVISDIQTSGDLGARKWVVGERAPKPQTGSEGGQQ